MRDCIRAANLRSSSVTYATMIKTALRTTNAAIIGAGASRPAWTEGGLISVRAGSDTPVLPEVRAGSDSPGLPEVRAGSDTPGLPVAEQSSSVDLAEHRVDGAHDRDDVRHLVAGDDVRQHREVREGGAPPLEAIGLRAAVADEVAADLAARAFHPRVAFALRHSHLTDRLHAGPRRDRPLGQAVEPLPDDPDRLPEFDHAHAIARVAVTGGLHRHEEVEILVRRIRLGAAYVVADPRAADERAGHPDRLRELARDHAHALRADAEERVGVEHRLVLVEPRLDDVQGLADFLVPPRRQVVAGAADLVEAVEEPRAGQLLEAIEDHLALADAVEEHGGAAAERATHVHAPGAEPEAVRRDPLQFGRDHSQVLRPPRHLELRDLLDGRDVRELRGHGRDVVRLRRDRRVLDVREGLAKLLVAAVEIADHRVDGDDRLALEGEDHPEDAV